MLQITADWTAVWLAKTMRGARRTSESPLADVPLTLSIDDVARRLGRPGRFHHWTRVDLDIWSAGYLTRLQDAKGEIAVGPAVDSCHSQFGCFRKR